MGKQKDEPQIKQNLDSYIRPTDRMGLQTSESAAPDAERAKQQKRKMIWIKMQVTHHSKKNTHTNNKQEKKKKTHRKASEER